MVKHEAEYENGGAGLIGFLAGIGFLFSYLGAA